MVFRRTDADLKVQLQELQAEIAVLREHIQKLESSSTIGSASTEPILHDPRSPTNYASNGPSSSSSPSASKLLLSSKEEGVQPSKNSINVSIFLWET